jgi:hypothetical protein
VDELLLSGGEQIYCLNEAQMQKALKLAREDPVSAPRIQRMLRELESDLSRNERAALAFLLIDRLLHSPG